MKHFSVRNTALIPLVLCLIAAAPLTSVAQDLGPPKIMVIDREFLKPGKSGTLHEKSESAFIRGSVAAKSTSYYFGMDSLTGSPRSLFFFPYTSFAAWEMDMKKSRKDLVYQAAMDHASNVDGDLLSAYEQSAFMLRPDLSLNLKPLAGARYMEITQYIAKPGHTAELEEAAKLYVAGFKKAALSYNWATYQLMYGNGTGDAFVVISLMKSLDEADKEQGLFEAFGKSMGESGMKKLNDLAASSVASQSTNLFELNPKISYPTPDIINGEPDFWKAKPVATIKKADAAK